MDRELFLLAALVDGPLTVRQIYQRLVPLAGDSNTTAQDAQRHMGQRTAAVPYCHETEIVADLAHLLIYGKVMGTRWMAEEPWRITDKGKAYLVWHGNAALFIGHAAARAEVPAKS